MPCLRLLLMLCLTLLALRACAASAADIPATFPQTALSNGLLHAVVLLPDPKTGYYRGSRFDWSGMIARVTYQGHTYFGEWKTPHSPAGNDDVVGPAEEFGMGDAGMPGPLGYEEAKPGETFLKIGIGLLEKPVEPAYHYGNDYRVVQPGGWQITTGSTWVEFRQQLTDPRGWGYDYTKRISLLRGRPELVISHRFTNTGAREIATTQYCHNFTIIDDEPIGPAYAVRYPFEVTASASLGPLAEARGNTISFPQTLTPDQDVDADLFGYTDSIGDNAVTIENLKTRAGLRIQGTCPLAQLHIYAARTAVCPEPFISLHLAPGEQLQWENSYSFYLAGAR